MDLNRVILLGKVEGNPQVSTSEGTAQVAFILAVKRRAQQPNGQWVDRITKAPCYASAKVAEVISKYVSDGHEVLIEASYDNWEQGHGMFVNTISFGYNPNNRKQNDMDSNPNPDIPY